jgi:hypothetical protein
MKKLLSFAFAAALCTPLFAQKMGSTNTNAPTLKQSIVAGDAKMSLDYTSITWADGKTIARLMDKEGGAKAREGFNARGSKAPLATFSTSIDVKCGDLQLAAGEYSVYFTIDNDCAWQINFQNKDGKAQTMKLKLEGSEHESKRLLLCLYAEDAGAGVYVSFGKQSGMLSFAPAKAG